MSAGPPEGARPGRAGWEAEQSYLGKGTSACTVPPFKAQLVCGEESTVDAIHVLSNVRNCANTTLIFISN